MGDGIRSYLPEAEHEKLCSVQMDTRAVFLLADASGDVILGGSGDFFAPGDSFLRSLSLPASELDFFRFHLSRKQPVLVLSGRGPLLLFPDFFAQGLIFALLPRLFSLPLGSSFILSPAAEASLSDAPRNVDEQRLLTEQLFSLSRILSPASRTDFRLHCAQIASFCGCRACVSDLASGFFPIADSDFRLFTAFLLCLFSLLRGTSPSGPSIRLFDASLHDLSLSLSHAPASDASLPLPLSSLLSSPLFSSFSLSSSGSRLALSAILRRSGSVSAFGMVFSLVFCVE